MRVLLSGGGTGGHIYPALAIAESIKKRIPDAEIAFVGTPTGMENRLIPREGYKLYHVDVRGFSRSLSFRNIKAVYLALTSPRKKRCNERQEIPHRDADDVKMCQTISTKLKERKTK